MTSEALLRFATWVEVHVPDDSEIIAPRDSFEHNDRTMAKRRIPAHARETLVPLSDLARLSPP